MSEQDLREGLWAAVADEPMLSLDPEALISQARQDIRRRRTLVGAGTATAAVAVAAVALPTMLGAPRGLFDSGGPGGGDGCTSDVPSPGPLPTSLEPPPVRYFPSSPASEIPLPELSVPSVPPSSGFKIEQPSPSAPLTFSVVPLPSGVAVPTPSPGPCPPDGPMVSLPPPPVSSEPGAPQAPTIEWPPAHVKPVYYTAEQLRQRGAEMQAHLREQFAKIVPGATDITVGPFGGEAAGAVADGQTYLEAFVGFTLNNQRAAVSIFVAAPGSDAVAPPQVDCAPGCKLESVNDHYLMSKSEDLGNGGKVDSMTIYQGPGSVVKATAYNYDPTISVEPTYLQKIPLTVDQLGALVSDPKLGL